MWCHISWWVPNWAAIRIAALFGTHAGLTVWKYLMGGNTSQGVRLTPINSIIHQYKIYSWFDPYESLSEPPSDIHGNKNFINLTNCMA